MAVYTVQRGDSLSAIAKKLGISGGWQELYNVNKSVVGSNPNLIYAGQKLTYGSPTSSTSKAGTTKTKSQEVAESIAKQVGPTKEAFYKRFGTEQELIPTASLQQFAAEQVNPEAFRQAVTQTRDYDWQAAQKGLMRSGYGMTQREALLDELERSRREQVEQYMTTQKDLFTDWYGQQMRQYMESEDPSGYQLEAAGLGGAFENLGWTNQPSVPTTQYQYNPLDMRDYFRLGGRSGYSARPTNLYGTITPI